MDSGRRTTDLYGSLELEQDRLVDEYLARLCAEVFDLVFLQLDGLPWPVPAD